MPTMAACSGLALLALALCAGPIGAASKPHVFMVLIDDFGWANVGFHRDASFQEVQTPNIMDMVAEGIILDNAYSYKSSLQSGRLPVHVNVLNIDPSSWNPKDPVSGFQGIPRNMTGMAELMQKAGYKTHMVGKWDAGMATPDHTPQGRGYDTSFHYFHHANDYWTEHVGPYVDMWNTSGPARGDNGSVSYGPTGPLEAYEEFKFTNSVLSTLDAHDPSVPLFFNYDFHIVHEPLQVPNVTYNKFNFMTNDFQHHRQLYTSMVHFMDESVGKIVAKLKAKGMYDNTVMFFQSDNGGPSFAGSSHTANNYPLRGTKMSNWQGGVRVNAWVGGGYLKTACPERLGTKLEGMTSVADYYATIAHGIAGMDPEDKRAAAANLPPIDSMDLWPYITGKAPASPRTELFGDFTMLISGDWKIMQGDNKDACWAGPRYPNGTDNPECVTVEHCGDGGCLYNIANDPSEYVNLAASQPEKLKEMQQALSKAQATFFSPDRSGGDPKLAGNTAKDKWGGFWGPFLP